MLRFICTIAQIILFLNFIVGVFKPDLVIRKDLPIKMSKRLVIIVGYFVLAFVVGYIYPEVTPEEIAQRQREAQAEREADSIRHVVSSCDVAVRYYLKGTLNDPDSYEAVSWTRPVRVDGGYVLVHKYRAKNGFGAKVLATNTFKLDNNFNIIKVQ